MKGDSALGAGKSSVPTQSNKKKAVEEEEKEEEKTCTICFDPYLLPHYPEIKLRCGHGYHDHCLKEWGKHCKFCPLCRAEMIPAVNGNTPSSTSAVADNRTARLPQATPQRDTTQKVHIGNTLHELSRALPGSSSVGLGLFVASLVVTNIPSVDEMNDAMEKTRLAISNSSSYESFTRALNDLPGHAQSGNLSHGISKVATAAGRGVASASWEISGQVANFGVTAIPMALGVAAIVGATPAVLLGLTVATAASVAMSAAHKNSSEYESQQKRYDEAFLQQQQQQQQQQQRQPQQQQQQQQHPVTDLVQCPQCNAMLRPPDGAPIFACPCGVHLQRP